MKRLAMAVSAGLMLFSQSGCVCYEHPRHRVVEEVYVEGEPAPPPVAEVEVIPVSPGPEFVWIAGFHAWRGGRYVWVRGHYERRGGHGHWVPAHWERRGHRSFWVEGHWD